MKITLATIGRFHILPLARELERLGHLEAVYSGFPWSRLAREGVGREKVRTYPWIRPLLMGTRFLPFDLPEGARDALHQLSLVTLDRHVARTLPQSDVYVGHEGVGLVSGAEAQRRGMLYVCDRGCTHMAWRERILHEENERLGFKPRRRPNTYAREIAEYEQADLIAVPSRFVADSFIAEGIGAEKLAVVPYGVNLERFHPVARPDPERFDVVFAGSISARKGIADLLEGFRRARIPGKHLTLVGTPDEEICSRFSTEFSADDISLRGHVAHDTLKEVLSRAHVFCLPSIEDGFGMVVPEAMACGCPVIVTQHAGGADIVEEGRNGFIIPIRDPDMLAAQLEVLAEDRERRDAMGAAALESVRALGGWESYGRAMAAAYTQAIAQRDGETASQETV